MKKGLKTKVVGISLGLATVLALAACGGGASSSQPGSSQGGSSTAPSSVLPSSSEKPSSVLPSSSEQPKSSSSQAPVVYAISITNKAAFAEKWYVGTTRKLELDVSPKGDIAALIAAGEIVIESDDEDVVAVGEDGLTLTALKAGEAEITVTYQKKSDSVEVAPEVNYTEIAITNKTALQAEWYVGDASRKMDLVTTPEGNITQLILEGKIEFGSSDEDVITNVGGALTARGRGTATVFVTLNGHRDEVEIEIKDVDYVSIESVVTAMKTSSSVAACHVRGIVTQVIDTKSCFIQQGNYGIYVYNKNYANIAVGDYVHCAASFKLYAGLPETDSCTLFEKIDEEAPETIVAKEFNKDSDALVFEDINRLFNVEDLSINAISTPGVAQSAYLFATAKVGANVAGIYASKYTTEENMTAIMAKVNDAFDNGKQIKLTGVGLYYSNAPYFAISSPDQIELVAVTEVYPTGIEEITSGGNDYVSGAKFKLGVKFTNDEECNKRKIKWEALNPEVATVDENGNVVVLAAGTASFKATSDYEGYEGINKTREYTFAEATGLDFGTLDEPLTVTEARALVDRFGSATVSSKMFVTGEVASQSAYAAKYSNYDYMWLDSTAKEEGFEVYQFVFDADVPGAATDYLEADATKGYIAIATGWACNFNGTYEFTNKNPEGTTDRAKVVYLECDPTGVELDLEEVTVTIGGSQKLTATWVPAVGKGEFSWGTANENIATVDDEGNVDGVAEGETTVYVYLDANDNGQWDEDEIKAECAVEVTSAPIVLESVEISGDATNYFGEDDDLTATPTVGALGVTYEWALAEGDEGKGTLTADGATCKFVAAGTNEAKTVTVKVTAKQAGAADVTDEFVITVKEWVKHAGTLEDPYDIADAYLACDRWPTGGHEVYITGKVSKVSTSASDIAKYKNLNFDISADGKTSGNQFTCYKTLSFNGGQILTPFDIEVGDTVVIKGETKIYKKDGNPDVYETQDNPVLISNDKAIKTIRIGGVADGEVFVDESVTLSPYIGPCEGEPLGYTFSYESNSANATVDGNGVVTGVSAGSVVITITASKQDCADVTKTITITVKTKESPTIGGSLTLDVGMLATPADPTQSGYAKYNGNYTVSGHTFTTYQVMSNKNFTEKISGTATTVAAENTVLQTQKSAGTYTCANLSVKTVTITFMSNAPVNNLFTAKVGSTAMTAGTPVDNGLVNEGGTYYKYVQTFTLTEVTTGQLVIAAGSGGNYLVQSIVISDVA